jgi:short-subunit dehydrogenase
MSLIKPHAIVVGASSGIGKSLALKLAQEGYRISICARRLHLLEEIQRNQKNIYRCYEMDLNDVERSREIFLKMLKDLGDVDVVILNAAINHANPLLETRLETETLRVNVEGFMVLACESINYFRKKKKGHLVGISSIAGLKGSAACPAYSASKAYISNYMQALRGLNLDLPIYVTDIRPGFVSTAMIGNKKESLLVATPEKVARQIYKAILKKKKVTYVTRRWNFIAFLYGLMPEFLFQWLYKKYSHRQIAKYLSSQI